LVAKIDLRLHLVESIYATQIGDTVDKIDTEDSGGILKRIELKIQVEERSQVN
jgi:hypothetical protein